MQCVRRPLIPWERAWHVLEQQRGQCGWSGEGGEWEEMMVVCEDGASSCRALEAIDGTPLESSSRGMGESEHTNGQWPDHVQK